MHHVVAPSLLTLFFNLLKFERVEMVFEMDLNFVPPLFPIPLPVALPIALSETEGNGIPGAPRVGFPPPF